MKYLHALPLLMVLAGSLTAAPNDWAEGTPEKDNGATRDYYNRAGLLEWKNKMGDWRDAKNAPQGDDAYALAEVAKAQKDKFVEWDVTALVREWKSGTFQNQGLFLRVVNGKGVFQFASREHEDSARRPQIVLTGDKGTVTLMPQADTYLEASTVRSLGNQDHLKISNRPNHALLRFDPRGGKEIGKPTKAVLRLFNTTQTSGASASIGVFRCQQSHDVADTEPIFGLAAKYPGDHGIGKDPSVVFSTGFEAEKWREEWSEGADRKLIEVVMSDPMRKFAPFQGKALSANLGKGESTALNLLYKFKPKIGAEPEEMFFRYYLRLGDDWNQTVSGGKLPGFSGTYGKAGWGGRKSDGANGWSARGWFTLTIPDDNPLAGLQPIGTYCYHTDQKGTYGYTSVWQRGYRGFLAKNRWYCIEQHVKLNKPGDKDGAIRAWVDGRLAFEKTDLRYRQVDRLKIEQVWMNVYHGGTTLSPHDQHVFIDNVVIARKYIGPMK